MPYALRAQHDGANYFLINRPGATAAIELARDATLGEAPDAVPEQALAIATLDDAQRECDLLNVNVAGYAWYPVDMSVTVEALERAFVDETAPDEPLRETRETRGA